MRREERRMESARTVSSETEKEISTKNIPEKEASEIAYQNKDIASKIFAEQLKGKSFNVYGVETGKIKAVLPTNIPAIKVNELRLDNLLELEDREQQLFVLAGILTFTDKIIDEEHAKTIRRAIQMTKVAMIFEKEKEEAVKREREKMEQIAREERERIQQAAKEKRRKALMAEKRKIALKMLADGELSPEKIAQYAGINIKTVKKLAGQQSRDPIGNRNAPAILYKRRSVIYTKVEKGLGGNDRLPEIISPMNLIKVTGGRTCYGKHSMERKIQYRCGGSGQSPRQAFSDCEEDDGYGGKWGHE